MEMVAFEVEEALVAGAIEDKELAAAVVVCEVEAAAGVAAPVDGAEDPDAGVAAGVLEPAADAAVEPDPRPEKADATSEDDR